MFPTYSGLQIGPKSVEAKLAAKASAMAALINLSNGKPAPSPAPASGFMAIGAALINLNGEGNTAYGLQWQDYVMSAKAARDNPEIWSNVPLTDGQLTGIAAKVRAGSKIQSDQGAVILAHPGMLARFIKLVNAAATGMDSSSNDTGKIYSDPTALPPVPDKPKPGDAGPTPPPARDVPVEPTAPSNLWWWVGGFVAVSVIAPIAVGLVVARLTSKGA